MTATALWKMYEPAVGALQVRQQFEKARISAHENEDRSKVTSALALAFFQSIFDSCTFVGKCFIESVVLWLHGDETAANCFFHNAHEAYYSVKMIALLPLMLIASLYAPKDAIGQLEYPLNTPPTQEEIEMAVRLPLASQIVQFQTQIQNQIERNLHVQNVLLEETERANGLAVNYENECNKSQRLETEKNGLTLELDNAKKECADWEKKYLTLQKKLKIMLNE